MVCKVLTGHVRNQAVHEPVELPSIGRELTATSDFSPATHIAVGVDPGVTQAIKAAHAMRDLATGQVLRQWEWELTKGQLKHDSGLTKAKQNTTRWWLDRDTNPCLNFQRIGESKQRPLELCRWDDLEALPPIGKEYQQGYKRLNDRLPKVKQRLHRAAEFWRGIDGRARNNA
ncbi:hypothetical protein QJQ45_007044 [Haematococcus lacustris]|nr:hypothetical protein QJQ45_007044 [Haematococcus lacustris]